MVRGRLEMLFARLLFLSRQTAQTIFSKNGSIQHTAETTTTTTAIDKENFYFTLADSTIYRRSKIQEHSPLCYVIQTFNQTLDRLPKLFPSDAKYAARVKNFSPAKEAK